MISSIKEKFKLIYLPFLFVSIGFVAIYTFAHWFFVLEKEWVSLDEELIDIWIPGVLAWIPIFFWLKPRLLLFDWKEKDNPDIAYQLFTVLFIVFCSANIQQYLRKTSSNLIHLTDISEIKTNTSTKYYTIDSFDIQREIFQASWNIKSTDDYLNIHLYIMTPIFSRSKNDDVNQFKKKLLLNPKLKQTISILKNSNTPVLFNGNDVPNIKYWYGVEFKKQYEYSYINTKSQKNINEFISETVKKYKIYDFQNFEYLETLGNSETKKYFLEAIENSKKIKTDEVIVFTPVQESFTERTKSNIRWLFYSLAVGLLGFAITLSFYPLDKTAVTNWKKGKKVESPDEQILRNIIIPNSKVFVTPLLIYSCITIFIIMIFNNVHVMYPDGRDLIDFGSIHGNSIENGEWWRLITGIFLHAGIWHLVLNMVHIFLLGGSFEEVIGKFKFLLVFMITGVLASYISFSCNISVNSVGASGAIFGLYGFILTLLLVKDKLTQSMNFALPTIIALASINLILGLFEGSVDNAAHIGGFVSGVILGLMQYGYNRFASH